MRQYLTKKPLCLLYSFSMCLGIDPYDVQEMLLRDPMEVVRPDAKGELMFRGSHIEEFVDLCLGEGYRLAKVEFDPWLGTPDHKEQLFITVEERMERFKKHLDDQKAVLIGMLDNTPGRRHAVATNGVNVYDSRGPKYPLDKIMTSDFYPIEAWILVDDLR